MPHAAPERGELALDSGDPLIDVVIEGVKMRLRVDLGGHDTIELNPAAAARVPVRYQSGIDVMVGRVRLAGRAAIARVRIENVVRSIQIAEHGRMCCDGADGAIGPQLLPYGRIIWRNRTAPAATGAVALMLDDDEATGLSAAGDGEAAGVRIRFALDQAQSGATAAAGAVLATRLGGVWDGPAERVPAAFGITRPARPIRFARAVQLAGFRFDRLVVRTADFGGTEALPADPVTPNEIVVSHRLPRQEAWPAVTLGADRLARCAEIAFVAQPRSLTLHCAFD